MSQTHLCVLCAGRRPPRNTTLTSGHVCQPCVSRLSSDLAAIGTLVEAAATYVPRKAASGPMGGAMGAKPPCPLDSLDPELTFITVDGEPQPLLVVLEGYERLIREMREMAPYGPVSANRQRHRRASQSPTAATLTGVLGFLASQVEWTTTEPEFPVEEYARAVRLSASALRRYDVDADERATRIPCPTITVEGECGYLLRVSTGTVHCVRCGRDWEVARLCAVAGAESDAWVDAEALAQMAGIHERTIKRWAARGWVARKGMLYSLADVRTVTERHAE